MSFKRIGDICSLDRQIISPTKGTEYTLYSFSAFDNNQIPEIVDGAYIKSAKLKVHENRILYNKLNVKFHRVWNIKNLSCVNPICSTEFFPLKVREGISQDFLYFNLISNSLTKTMDSHRKGTSNSQQRIDINTLFNYQIFCPSYDTQCKIASILSSFDDKIKENNAINQNLEEQAKARYENLVSIINNSSSSYEISLSELMTYSGGSQPPASQFIFDEKDGYVRFVQIRDYETDTHITYIPVSPKNRLCEEHDIMIARYGASLGRICFGLNGAYNVALAKVFPRKPYYREFLRCYLSSREFYEGINNRGGRSAQAGFNQSDIKSFKLMFPKNEDLILNFENFASSLFEMRISLKKENERLANLRDTLLPKLLTGELDVLAVDI